MIQNIQKYDKCLSKFWIQDKWLGNFKMVKSLWFSEKCYESVKYSSIAIGMYFLITMGEFPFKKRMKEFVIEILLLLLSPIVPKNLKTTQIK